MYCWEPSFAGQRCGLSTMSATTLSGANTRSGLQVTRCYLRRRRGVSALSRVRKNSVTAEKNVEPSWLAPSQVVEHGVGTQNVASLLLVLPCLDRFRTWL